MNDTVHLTRENARAVAHLLTASALANCAGTADRLDLDGDTLTVTDLDGWSWSSGEWLLLAALLHFAGLGRIPTPDALTQLDEDNRRVVVEALHLAETGYDRLLAAVEAAPGGEQ